jgi:hypothetical protein
MPLPDSLGLEVAWVPLPNGVSDDGSELLFSVFVAPALTGDDSGGTPALAHYPALLDWPAVVEGLEVGVEFDGTGDRVAARILPGPRSSQIWRALFGPATTVAPFVRENLTERPVMTFSAETVLETVRDSYARLVVDAIDDLAMIAPLAQTLAAGAADPPFAAFARALQTPTLQQLMGGAEIRTATLQGLVADATVSSTSPTGMIEMMAPGDGPSAEVARAVAFHTAQQEASPPETDAGRLAAERAALHDSVDFHRILSGLNEHPALLRRLGLVFDVAVPLQAAGGRSSGAARLVPQWSAGFPDPASRQSDRTLWVAWDLDPHGLFAFVASADHVPGVLDLGLDSSPFSVHPVGLDGAVLQAIAMVSSLPPGGAPGAPPAVRSGGLTLTQADRAEAVHADLSAAMDDGRGATPESALRAEDVVRGYRFDVLDETTGRWASLHARRVSYTRDDAELLDPVLDEGSHHPTVTGPPVPAGSDPDTGAPLYVHESFVRWDGWSLSAPRPGRSLGVDPDGPDPDRPETMPQRSSNDPLTQAGLRIETTVQPRTLPRLRFGHSYRIRARTVDLAGNGLDLPAAEEFWGSTMGVAGGGIIETTDLATPSMRFSRFEPVPPPTIVQSNPQPQSVHRLVIRSGTDDPAAAVRAAECRLYAPKASIQLAEWHGRFDDAIGSRDPAKVRASYDVAARESGALPATGADELPYLPDPFSRGIAIAHAPGVPLGETPSIEWRGPSWDRPRPITLRLLANDQHFQPGPDLNPDAATVTLKLDPARQATLRLSSMIDDADAFGLLEWLGEGTGTDIDPTTMSRVRRAVEHSRHVMFTPWEELRIVHAVQRPLSAPDLRAAPDVMRQPGETEYAPNVTLVPEPLSTGELQLDATWTDVVDDPAVRFEPPAAGEPMPWLRPVSATVGSTALEEPELVDGVVPIAPETTLYDIEGSSMPPLQFSDTRHRTLTLTATAVSRFADEFPELAGEPSRFTRTGRAVEAVVLSTSRPPAPAIADVVPIVSTGPVSVERGDLVREGGWLRVWLERPCFVTGADERFGIVVLPRTPAGPADPMYGDVSVVGTDAAHEGPFMTGLRIDHVLNAAGLVSGSRLLENPAEPVDLALFEPEFDFVSQRWFADVRIDTRGAYFPMIRLVAVRYQPHAIELPPESGATPGQFSVSPPVRLDPIPLFPERRLFVQKVLKPNHTLLRFELSGTPYTATSSLTSTRDATKRALARVTVRTQHRLPGELAGGDEHWLNGEPVDLTRDSTGKPWRLQLEDDALRDFLAGAERILLLEEDHVPFDPAVPQPDPFAARPVFAAVVEGPFTPTG